VIFLLFAPLIVSPFTTQAEVAGYAVRCLRIVSVGFLFYGTAMTLTAAFNGAGDTRTPTLINVVCLWLFEVRWPGYWPIAWASAVRRLHRADVRLLVDVRAERVDLQEGDMENSTRLIAMPRGVS